MTDQFRVGIGYSRTCPACPNSNPNCVNQLNEQGHMYSSSDTIYAIFQTWCVGGTPTSSVVWSQWNGSSWTQYFVWTPPQSYPTAMEAYINPAPAGYYKVEYAGYYVYFSIDKSTPTVPISTTQYSIQITAGTGGQIQVFQNDTDLGYFRGTKTIIANDGDNISVWCDPDTGYTFTNLCTNDGAACTTDRPFNFVANMNIGMTATFTSTSTTPPPTTQPPSGTSVCQAQNQTGNAAWQAKGMTCISSNCGGGCSDYPSSAGSCGCIAICSGTPSTSPPPGTTLPPTTQPPGTTRPPTTQPHSIQCDPNTRFNIPSIGCVPKNYIIYGAVGIVALMMFKR